MAERQRLQDRHALVTGAAGGIGLAVLQAYLDEGARCTAADLPREPNAALTELIERYPRQLHYLSANVAINESIDAMVAYEYAKVRYLYANRLKIADRTEIEYQVGGHRVFGKGTYAFLAKHLNWKQ